MRTVEDDEGTRYLLLKESRDSSLVRDPTSGETRYLPTSELAPVAGESPLVTAAAAVSEPTRDELPALADDRALGLLVVVARRQPVAVRTLLALDLCESDLHGLLGELRAAELIAETTVAGERGYETTPAAAPVTAELDD